MTPLKNTRFFVRTDGDLKQMIESYCEKHGTTVSDFIRTALVEKATGSKVKTRRNAKAKRQAKSYDTHKKNVR